MVSKKTGFLPTNHYYTYYISSRNQRNYWKEMIFFVLFQVGGCVEEICKMFRSVGNSLHGGLGFPCFNHLPTSFRVRSDETRFDWTLLPKCKTHGVVNLLFSRTRSLAFDFDHRLLACTAHWIGTGLTGQKLVMSHIVAGSMSITDWSVLGHNEIAQRVDCICFHIVIHLAVG